MFIRREYQNKYAEILRPKFGGKYRGFTQKISNFYSAYELSNRMQKVQNTKKMIPKVIPLL